MIDDINPARMSWTTLEKTMTYYSQGGIRVEIDGQIVTVSLGAWNGKAYMATASYRCRVPVGYMHLTVNAVASGIGERLGIADARKEHFNFRNALDSIARQNLAIPSSLEIIDAAKE